MNRISAPHTPSQPSQLPNTLTAYTAEAVKLLVERVSMI